MPAWVAIRFESMTALMVQDRIAADLAPVNHASLQHQDDRRVKAIIVIAAPARRALRHRQVVHRDDCQAFRRGDRRLPRALRRINVAPWVDLASDGQNSGRGFDGTACERNG